MDSRLPKVLQSLPDPWVVVDDETQPPAPLSALAERLGYAFSRPSLLRVALTLGSWSNEHADLGWPSNACLEFFGDAVLDLVVADLLWRRFPEVDEGKLTRLRSVLVAEAALAEVAQRLDLGPHLFLGRGDARRGGREHAGTLADAMEAIFGAVFLDARERGEDGVAAATGVFERAFADILQDLSDERAIDPKTQLQHWAQAQYRVTPTYVRVGHDASSEEPSWRVHVELRFPDGRVLVLGQGEGRTLRIAERRAASEALEAQLNDAR